jgi:hypothetical protein
MSEEIAARGSRNLETDVPFSLHMDQWKTSRSIDHVRLKHDFIGLTALMDVVARRSRIL